MPRELSGIIDTEFVFSKCCLHRDFQMAFHAKAEPDRVHEALRFQGPHVLALTWDRARINPAASLPPALEPLSCLVPEALGLGRHSLLLFHGEARNQPRSPVALTQPVF